MVLRHWIYSTVAVGMLAVVGLYAFNLTSPLVFDDIYPFLLRSDGSIALEQFRNFSLLTLRALPYVTLVWTTDWFGFELMPLRVGNLMLHLLTVLALFMFLSKLFSRLVPERAGALQPRYWAMGVALLFALHPVAVYAVGYLVQRSMLMSTLFSLLALYAYLQASLSGRRRWWLASVFFYYWAVFSKEHAVMLPVAFILLEVLLHADWARRLRTNWLTYLAYSVIILLAVLARTRMIGSSYELEGESMLSSLGVAHPYPLSVLTQCWLFFKYGFLWLLPNSGWMSVDMRERFATGFFSPYVFAPLLYLGWGWLGFTLLLRRGQTGLLGFAMLFPWLMFMTELVTVRIQEPFVLYRSYLWAVGGAAALPVLLGWLRDKVAVTALVLVAIAYVPISAERLQSFSHPLLLWQDALEKLDGDMTRPGAYRILYNHATELMKQGLNVEVAARELQKAGELYPHWPDIYGNLGHALLILQEPAEGLAAFDRALVIAAEMPKRSSMRYHYGRGDALMALGRVQEARGEYVLVCAETGQACDKP